jgi:succinate-semialdehyde dehydrogenase/glutarate-semialdehyde dehydrogenase
MELGGKAPLIVSSDVDLERAARGAVFGAFSNAGQICIAVERVFAHQAVAERFTARVVELTNELRVGDPLTGEIDVGAIIFPKQLAIAEAHLADATAKGARILTGGKRLDGPGQFFAPTVIAGCTPDMTVMTDEIFGPLLPIMQVGDDDEAVRLANASNLGLNAYVFARDRAYGQRLAERIEAGSVLVNDVLSNGGCPEAPFGGIKQSGFGRMMGDDSLREMSDVRHVSVDRIAPSHDPLWFPYTKGRLELARRATQLALGGGSLRTRLRRLFGRSEG